MAIKIEVITVEMGHVVLCDFCSVDFTFSEACGGLLFQSKGICPTCTPGFMKKVEAYNEQEYIRARPFPNEQFRHFIYRIRNGDYRSPELDGEGAAGVGDGTPGAGT